MRRFAAKRLVCRGLWRHDPDRSNPMPDDAMSAKRSEAAKKAAATRKRRAAGKKAALTRKRREAGRKAAQTCQCIQPGWLLGFHSQLDVILPRQESGSSDVRCKEMIRM